jgi:hypothetical protein
LRDGPTDVPTVNPQSGSMRPGRFLSAEFITFVSGPCPVCCAGLILRLACAFASGAVANDRHIMAVKGSTLDHQRRPFIFLLQKLLDWTLQTTLLTGHTQ